MRWQQRLVPSPPSHPVRFGRALPNAILHGDAVLLAPALVQALPEADDHLGQLHRQAFIKHLLHGTVLAHPFHLNLKLHML